MTFTMRSSGREIFKAPLRFHLDVCVTRVNRKVNCMLLNDMREISERHGGRCLSE